MKQVKIRFKANDGIEYAPGQKVSDEVAKQYPQFVKESPVAEKVVESKPEPVVEEVADKSDDESEVKAIKTPAKKTTKKTSKK